MTWPHMIVPEDEERIIRFRPAFHRCHPDPSKDYGISSVRMLWVLRVDDWAMSWDTNTGWGMPDEAFKAAAPDCTHPRHQVRMPLHEVNAGAVDWHTPVPRWEGQEPSQEQCSITGTRCYLDTGFLVAEEVLHLLETKGDEAVWEWLRAAMDEVRAEVASR